MSISGPIDPILLEVLKNAFETIADEMALITTGDGARITSGCRW